MLFCHSSYIGFAQHAGVTTEAELSSPENNIHPDFVTGQLPDLLEAAKGSKVPA